MNEQTNALLKEILASLLRLERLVASRLPTNGGPTYQEIGDSVEELLRPGNDR
jgi:hypothetical protein